MFKESLEESVKGVNSRPQYAELAKHMENLSKIPGGKAAALIIRDEWLETYRKRPAMIDELKRQGCSQTQYPDHPFSKFFPQKQ